jgi:thiol-disulfide isomerase/thioredoxin
MKRLVATGLAVLLMTGNLLAQQDEFEREGTAEQRAIKDLLEKKAPPPLEAKEWMNTNGKELKWEDLKGKVVVIDFWGVWCPPCRAAMPHLKELYQKHKADGLVIVGIHTTDQGERMADFAKQQGIDWPIAIDIDKKTVQAFRVDSYPDYYLIDRAGNLRVADLKNASLDRAVEILLKEKAGK